MTYPPPPPPPGQDPTQAYGYTPAPGGYPPAAPPPGGFGGPPTGGYSPQQPPKKGMSTGTVIGIAVVVVIAALAAVIGVVAVTSGGDDEPVRTTAPERDRDDDTTTTTSTTTTTTSTTTTTTTAPAPSGPSIDGGASASGFVAEFESEFHTISVPAGTVEILLVTPLTDFDIVAEGEGETFDSGLSGESERIEVTGPLTFTLEVSGFAGASGSYELRFE